LRDITNENWHECIQLRVRDDQPYVAPNLYSIAQSKVEPRWIPMAVYNDETMVGFIMYELDYRNKQLYLCRFMIDQRYQHKGYGKGTLDILREIAMRDPGIEKVELSTNPKNAHGIKVYTRYGFRDTGILDDGEEVFVLDLQKLCLDCIDKHHSGVF
jgi:diamine N-acetyltransferase